MLREKLKNYNIILASGSPRRQHFFQELDLDFTIDVREVDEVFPSEMKREQITNYLAQLKVSAFTDLKENDIVITSDTIVWHKDEALNKPKDFEDAKAMLKSLSGQMHVVLTSVCFTSRDWQKTVYDVTKVYFKEISEAQIEYYLHTCKPFDKAGSYGIQDWLGYVGIEKIEGCFFNVMGLPTRLVNETLLELASEKK
ncbi:MAG: Maf family nucleotide pyrophosphatase [Patiriisocius sp.]|uniref:Maf family nucleotide pyrophosphatase n=1 Tax=Patiriisocius sp. TaxID=2822396 RepID=UPI003EF10D18